MTDTVGTHTLPTRLVEAMETGEWSNDLLRLLQTHPLVDAHDDHSFLSIEAMRRDLANIQSLVDEGIGRIYAMASSVSEGKPIGLPLLDVDMGVPLITEAGEPLVWLDYRNAPANVLILVGPPLRWEAIANSFGSFLAHLRCGWNGP